MNALPVAEDLLHLDVGDGHGAPVHDTGLEQLRIARETGEAVYASVSESRARREQADPGALDEVLNAVEAAVAGEFRDQQSCIPEHAHETRGAALGPGIAGAVRSRRGHHQEGRGRDERSRTLVECRHLLGEHPLERLSDQFPDCPADEMVWASASIMFLVYRRRGRLPCSGDRIWHVPGLPAPVASGASSTGSPAEREADTRNILARLDAPLVVTVVRPWRVRSRARRHRARCLRRARPAHGLDQRRARHDHDQIYTCSIADPLPVSSSCSMTTREARIGASLCFPVAHTAAMADELFLTISTVRTSPHSR